MPLPDKQILLISKRLLMIGRCAADAIRSFISHIHFLHINGDLADFAGRSLTISVQSTDRFAGSFYRPTNTCQ